MVSQKSVCSFAKKVRQDRNKNQVEEERQKKWPPREWENNIENVIIEPGLYTGIVKAYIKKKYIDHSQAKVNRRTDQQPPAL
jgi:hypothetical protein